MVRGNTGVMESAGLPARESGDRSILRFTIALLCVASCLGMAIRARAESHENRLPLSLSFQGCDRLPAGQVQRVVMVELGSPLDFRLPVTPEQATRVLVRCSEGAAQIEVEDPLRNSQLRRRVPLASEAEPARVRVLALSIVEAVEASRAEGYAARPANEPSDSVTPSLDGPVAGRSEPMDARRLELRSRAMRNALATLAHLSVLTAAGVVLAESESPAPSGDEAEQILPDGRPLRGPTSSDLLGLRVFEAEFNRYRELSRDYAFALDAIARREYDRRRDRLIGDLDRQRTAEDELLGEARNRAIEEFEHFLERYPNDPGYTPDAMFRLAELYYEDSFLDYLDRSDHFVALEQRRAAGEEVVPPPEPSKDFSRSISLFRRLLSEYPHFGHRDGALYLLGYCLNEMGRLEEALAAWLHLVCSNRFDHLGSTEEEPLDGEEHPSSSLPAMSGVQAETSSVRELAYRDCVPVVAESRFLEEVWLRVGEHHFDYDFSAGGLERAIQAYRNAMTDPQGPFYDEALYKLAWSYYRADHYVEAIRHFTMLVEYADDQLRRTGRTGAQMRPEAIQYLGIAFAEEDWNNDAVPDETRPLARIQDPSLLSQDERYAAEVYLATAQTLFDLARFGEAIQVFELTLERWPLLLEAPRIVQRIAEAHDALGELEASWVTTGRLAGYGEDSTYARTHGDEHPAEVDAARRLARTALRDDAIRHHGQAQRLRRAALEEEDAELLRQANAEYVLAARRYGEYLERYPNDPEAYELTYNLAEARYFSGRAREAAAAYGRVRDSGLDDRHREEAAFRCVKSLEEVVNAMVEANDIAIPEGPPEPEGDPPQVVQARIPEIVVELNDARDAYARLFPGTARAAVFGYQSAQVFYVHGQWITARERFTDLFEDVCERHIVAFHSWETLVSMAAALGDLGEVERLALLGRERSCIGAREPSAIAAVDPEGRVRPDPTDAAERLLESIRFHRAQESFNAAASEGESSLYEEAAALFLEAVAAAPRHELAPAALNNAALAYVELGRGSDAERLWTRILDEHSQDDLAESARFHVAVHAYRMLDHEEAVSHFSILARSARALEVRRDSILNSALILTTLRRYDEAASYWRQYAQPSIAPDSRRRAEAAFRAAEMASKQRDWAGATKELRRYISEYRTLPAAGSYRVKAASLVADAQEQLGNPREHHRALQGVLRQYERSGESSGSESAALAAKARFAIVDREMAELEGLTISGTAKAIEAQVEAGARRVRSLEEGFKSISTYRSPEWTVTAHARIGRAYELLAKAMLDAPSPTDAERLILGALPRETRRDLERLPASDRHALLAEQIDALEQEWREQMSQRVSGMEDRAVAEYRICVDAAREGNIVNEHTRAALARLYAYLPDEYPPAHEARTVLELDSVTPPDPER